MLDHRLLMLQIFVKTNIHPDTPARKAFHEIAIKQETKTRGGQRTHWLKTIKRDFKDIGKTVSKVIKITKGREKYALLVESAMARSQNRIA